MMETMAVVVPHDVYKYVHACDGRVDLSLEASIDGDVSPDVQLDEAASQQYYAQQEAPAASLANGAAYRPAEHSLEYQDPNGGGDHIENPEAGTYEGYPEEYEQNPAESGDTASFGEPLVQYTADNQPFYWDESAQSHFFLNADGTVGESFSFEDASQNTGVPAGADGEAVYADPAQVQEGVTEYAAAEAAVGQASHDEYGNQYTGEGYADHTQYVEQNSAEAEEYPVVYGEVAGVAPEAVEQPSEPQVLEAAPAEPTFTPEERQRDLDVAFFGAEQAYKLAQQAEAVKSAQDMAYATEQSYQAASDPGQGVHEGDTAAYSSQEVAEGYPYDAAACPLGAYYETAPVDQVALGGYQQEVPQAYDAGVPQGYESNVQETYEGEVQQTYEGDVQQAYEGEVQQTYEGEVQQTYEGEVLQTYEGEVQQTYGGEVQQTYEGEVQQTYEGEVQQTYEGEVQQTYEGEVQQSYEAEVQQTYEGEVQYSYDGGVPSGYEGEVAPTYEGEVQQFSAQEVPSSSEGEVQQTYEVEVQQTYEVEVQPTYEGEVQPTYEGEVQPTYEGEVQYTYESEVPSGYEGEVAPTYAGEVQQVFAQEVPQSSEGEVPQEYGGEAAQAYAGEADQATYQEQAEGEYHEQAELTESYDHGCAQGQYDVDGNLILDAAYSQHPGADANAPLTYDGVATESYPAEETTGYYDNSGVGTLQESEMTQDQAVYAQQEQGHGEYYDQQASVAVDAVVDPCQQGHYPEEAEAQQPLDTSTYYYPEQYDGTVTAELAYNSEAVDAQQYSADGSYAAVYSEIDTAQVAQAYQTENVPQLVEELYPQSDQGYLSEQANDSSENLIEATEVEQTSANGEVYAETGEQYQQHNSEEYPAQDEQYAEGYVQQYGEGTEQYTEAYQQQAVHAYEQPPVQDYTEEQLQAYAQECAEQGVEGYPPQNVEHYGQQFAAQETYPEQLPEDYQQQQTTEYTEQDPQMYETQAGLEGEDYSHVNGELPQEVLADPAENQGLGVSSNIVRGKPFTREMDSTEKFKSFQIEYERTPAFDAFGHCLKFLGVRKGFVCSIRADGVVCVQLKGAQQDEWQDTEFEYDSSKPAAKVEVGHMYIIAHSFDGNLYMERCRVKDIEDETAFVQLIDTGCERTIPKNQLYDIINLEEVERLPPQVVEIFVAGLTYEGYSKEDLERLEMEWNPYEEVFIIPVDAPKGGLIRTIVCRKTGETLGVRAAPQNANKTV